MKKNTSLNEHASAGSMMIDQTLEDRDLAAPRCRSARADVRNPILALPAVEKLRALSPDCRQALAAVLADISAGAAERAETSWRKHKGPMAAYWKAVAVYAKYIRRAL